jgi:hypothetical protein
MDCVRASCVPGNHVLAETKQCSRNPTCRGIQSQNSASLLKRVSRPFYSGTRTADDHRIHSFLARKPAVPRIHPRTTPGGKPQTSFLDCRRPLGSGLSIRPCVWAVLLFVKGPPQHAPFFVKIKLELRCRPSHNSHGHRNRFIHVASTCWDHEGLPIDRNGGRHRCWTQWHRNHVWVFSHFHRDQTFGQYFRSGEIRRTCRRIDPCRPDHWRRTLAAAWSRITLPCRRGTDETPSCRRSRLESVD